MKNTDLLKNTNELSFEIIKQKKMVFHSIFICPVSKEPSNEENPPCLLKCGHVISK